MTTIRTVANLELRDGRTVRYYDTGQRDDQRLVVFWHHGTPNIGTPPEPLFPISERLGIRWLSLDRPGYGDSTPVPGLSVGSVADDVARVADALDIDAFAVMGHSGGSSHALACAARLPDRVTAVVSMSALAPYGSSGLDWFAGMYPGGEAGLRTATEGRDAKERYEATAEYDPEMFTTEDHASLNGAWSWLNSVVEPALESGPGGLIDDDLAYVTPWDADPATIAVPTLIVHGGHDRIVPSAHGEWLASRIPGAELWLVPEAGHLSVLDTGERALAWLQQHTSR